MAKKKVKKQDWKIIDIIDTPYGQWEYPGAITRIPSNNITMRNVNYPVFGISDTGHSQMMYPNQDYQFEGSSVTEYPMMQAGGRAPIKETEVIILGNKNKPTYRDSLDAYNTALDVYRKIGKAFDEEYGYTGKNSTYAPFMEKLAKGEKPILKGNEKFFGVTNQPISGFSLDDDIKFWNDVVQSDPQSYSHLEVLKQLQRLKRLKVQPYAASHASELPTAYLYKKPVGEQPINIQSSKPDLLQSNNQLEFNPIPFKQGTYFTRPRQSGESGSTSFPDRNKPLTDYFDKKTGKLLGTYEFGGNLTTSNQNIPEMKKGGIHIKPSKKGTFKAQASKMGMGVQEAASKILNAPEGKYSPAMRRKANFAKNFAKADGGYPEVGGDLMNQPYYDFGQSQNNFLTNIKPIDSEPVITELDYNMQPFPELDIQNPYKFDPALTKSLERQSGNKPMLNPEEQAQYDQYNKFKNTKFSEAAPYIPTTSLFNNYYLNKGNQYRKKAIDSFSKLEDGGFGGGDYWNLGSGIANAITADINTAKGYTDIFGTLNTNRQIKAIEAQNKRANLLSQFENPTPTFQSGWGGNNPLENGYVPVGENGMSIKEMGGNGLPNVEIEGKENVKLPNGFSENVSGKTHAEGGIPLNLQVGSQILSEKLKHPETGKSYAKMAKKFQTKKDFKHLESKFSDPLNIKTAELNIQMKEQALDNLFMEQEKNKLLGKHGNKIKESTLEDYTMKYGGKLKQYSPGGVNDQTFTGVNPNVDFKTLRLKESEKQRRDKFLPYEPNEIPTGYGSQLALESIFNDFENQYGVKLPTGTNEQKLQALREYQTKLTPELTKDYKLNFARGNKELYQEYTKSKGYKANKDKEKESQNFYDWAKNSGKLTEDYANKGLWGHEYYNIAPLDFSTEAEFNKFTQDPDWAKVGNYYVDRSANPTDPITYYFINKKYEKPSVASKASDVPSTIDKVSPIEGKSNKRDFIPTITGLQFPDAYLRDPITVNNLQPEFYQPSTISPYLNDIQRLQYASNANLGTSGAELATRANLFGQGLNEYGKRYYDTSAFNAQAKTQAAAQNAQTKQRVNEFNMSNYIQNARNPQLQREATITEQKALNRNAELKKITDMEHEQRVQDYLANIYDPNYAFNANFNPYLSQKPAKYGTKIKLKNKKKK